MAGINYIQPSGGNKLYNHNFSYDNVLSGQIGKLIPIQCDEVLPNERWQENISFLMRLTPMVYPAMVKMNVCFYSFYVPTRIITPRNSAQSTWEKFILSLGKDSSEIPELPAIFTSKPITGEKYNQSVEMLQKYFAQGGLSDYLDILGIAPLPEEIANDNLFNIPEEFKLRIDGLLAYLYIYNYWFRRDQIEPEIKMPLSLGKIDLFDKGNSEYVHHEDWDESTPLDFFDWLDELFTLRDKNYERDYFTSALPEPQYGEDVTLGADAITFSTVAPVSGSFNVNLANHPGNSDISILGLGAKSGNYIFNAAYDAGVKPLSIMSLRAIDEATASTNYVYGFRDYVFSPSPAMIAEPRDISIWDGATTRIKPLSADLSQASANFSGITINQLRLGMQLQAVREAINRGGTMYIEIMQNVYDSLVPDARLQQPVYLGGIKCPVQIGTVVQSSETTSTTPLGTLAGKAQSANGGRLFRSKQSFKEHGYIMTICCVAPRTGYVGGVPRKWMKFDPIDYYNKYFAHLGEQEVYKGELHNNPFDGAQGQRGVFGYQERYHEYRHAYSRAHGAMRSQPKDAWHVYRTFDGVPSLSKDFIKMNPEHFNRLFEFETIDGTINEQFDLIVVFDIKKKSPVPKYGTPYNFI